MKKSLLTLLLSVGILTLFAQYPETFDLRNYNGENYVTSVKSQTSGTCWTHGTMASIEGNLMMNGNWMNGNDDPEPNLAEYHLDWWNGFNRYFNQDLDPPFNNGQGLEEHLGGDYFVSTAYMSRLEGMVYCPEANNSGEDDDNWFYSAPDRYDHDNYSMYYSKNVEWWTAGPDLEYINDIKELIMTHGVLATCMCYAGQYINNQYEHYQPPSSQDDPNHSVAIIGWDDTRDTQAPLPGAWIVKNSWGSWWGNSGYFWISYYDKHATQHPEMGAVTFYNTALMEYDSVYYHDYHGWRDTVPGITEAFNAYVAVADENFVAGSFYTGADNVDFEYRIYDDFDGTTLSNQLYVQMGTIPHSGLHTIDFYQNVYIDEGEDFYVYLKLSDGGMPYDRTSIIPVLLIEGNRYDLVPSTSAPGQSYYSDGKGWVDFYDYDDPSGYQNTGNFCIKAITGDYEIVGINDTEMTLPGMLASNYPNPFTDYTVLEFSVKENAHVEVMLTDLNGRTIDVLVNEETDSGTHTAVWNCAEIKAGIYMATLKVNGNLSSTLKLVKTK